MISFENDYNVGACREILDRLIETNMEPQSGYGQDAYCSSAVEKIRQAVGCDCAKVYFLVGGTQANAVVISSVLKPHEAVVAADTGHIGTHEAGAIEHSGHKVLTLPNRNGKISAPELDKYLEIYFSDANRLHMPRPAMVYISQPTELGSLYSKKELTEISAICRRRNMTLFMDGARLAYALGSRSNDLSLPDIASLCDVLYIGGTKCGAFCGEAVVFTKNNAPKYFFSMIKQHGALMAKGRLLGIQFDTLFTDDLYIRLGRAAIDRAEELKRVLKESGLQMYAETPTNQQFVIIRTDKIQELSKNISFSIWERADDEHTIIRFVTSWATKAEELTYLREVLGRLR